MKLNHSSDNHNVSLSEINIIPMVDIMLVLLIIFMVAAPMMQEGIKIDLPEVTAAAIDVSEEDFIVNVNDLGQIFINDNKTDTFSVISIQEKVMGALKDKKNKTVYLRADQTIKYGYIMEVMAALRRAGVEKLGMVTETREDVEGSKKYKTTAKR